MLAIGNMNFGGSFNGTYMFSGPAPQLQTRMETLTNSELQTTRDANITLIGTQVQGMGTCCFVCTIIWGSILIIPLFFMCCDWWQRMVYPAYDVPLVGYTCINSLFRFRAVQHLSLSVIDNTFDATKAGALYSVIQNSGLRSFSFVNSCGD